MNDFIDELEFELAAADLVSSLYYPYELVPVVKLDYEWLPVEGTLTAWWINGGYEKYVYPNG